MCAEALDGEGFVRVSKAHINTATDTDRRRSVANDQIDQEQLAKRAPLGRIGTQRNFAASLNRESEARQFVGSRRHFR